LNENHAREILELHTVGVDGGYTQADVTAFARVLTGWTVPRNLNAPNAGERFGRFAFSRSMHEPGDATIMGEQYSQPGVKKGEAVLRDLARHPATAKHIARKFARHFVADDPPATLVDRLAETFSDTAGDLQALSLTLIRSEESWGSTRKLRSPLEFLWSSLRALDISISPGFAVRTLRALGQAMWDIPSPQGFPDDTATWLAPDALADRLAVAEELGQLAGEVGNPSNILEAVLGPEVSDSTRQAVAFAESPAQGFALILMSPEFQWR
jgi:uncharacterized protein (DUF1800 family)